MLNSHVDLFRDTTRGSDLMWSALFKAEDSGSVRRHNLDLHDSRGFALRVSLSLTQAMVCSTDVSSCLQLEAHAEFISKLRQRQWNEVTIDCHFCIKNRLPSII